MPSINPPGINYRSATATVVSDPSADGKLSVGSVVSKDFDTKAVGTFETDVEHTVDLSKIRGPRRQKVFRELDKLQRAGILLGVIAITDITPSTGGNQAGGDAVTITGSGFKAGATVDIGGSAATSIVVVSDTQITAVTPAGTGTVDVVITNPDTNTATLSSGFTYAA